MNLQKMLVKIMVLEMTFLLTACVLTIPPPESQQSLAVSESSSPTLVPTTTSVPVPTTGIMGRVFRSDTDNSISLAVVELKVPISDEKFETIAELTTDEAGHYSFNDIEPGKYSINVLMEYENADDVPCGLEDMRLMNIKPTIDGWVSMVGHRESSNLYTVIVIGPGFDLQTNDILQIDVDVACKY